MTQEDKQLLIKDLCARLPYHTKCYCEWSKEAPNGTSGYIQELSTFLLDEFEMMDNPECDCQVSVIKPYLRSMSSMTEDEEIEFVAIGSTVSTYGVHNYFCVLSFDELDWLNARHFDYRGLIPMGLALEAPEGMYKTE